MRFADLLEKVSAVDPEMRIRFTAAHPKDFPEEVSQKELWAMGISPLFHCRALRLVLLGFSKGHQWIIG